MSPDTPSESQMIPLDDSTGVGDDDSDSFSFPETTGTSALPVGSIDLGSARGRRGAAAGGIEVVRELGPSDLDLLREPTPVGSPAQTLRQIRHSHHQLAQILARGDCTQEEAGLITGYSPTYISVLQSDPAFSDLVAYYSTQREQRVVDVWDRMRVLGLSTLDELQRRLEENPEEFTVRLLLEQLETLMVKPMQAAASRSGPTAAGSAGGVQVSVNFVTANHTQAETSQTIDITPDRDFVE